MEQSGAFFVIEGIDGSGKGTQFELLAARLRRTGYDVATFDFPQYDSPSSYFVKQYLNGAYGTVNEVGPYTASLFYALDRYEAAPAIREALQQGKVVLVNRFTGSNMAHQGTKFDHVEELRGFFIWLDNLEFVMLKIPRPTKSFVLRLPAEDAQALIAQKEARQYTDKVHDIHEADLTHLQKSVQVYDDLCQLFPKDFQRIDCVRSGNLLDISTVNDILWQTIEPLLPAPNNQQVITTPEPTIQTLQERPVEQADHIELTNVSALVKKTLLLNNLELSLSPSQEQRYFIPSNLSAELESTYRQAMDAFYEAYDENIASTTDFAKVLPMAHLQTISVTGSSLNLRAAAIELLSSPLHELQVAGKTLSGALQKQTGQDIPLELIKNYQQTHIKAITAAREHLDTEFSEVSQAVKLLDVSPRNETNLLSEILFAVSDNSFSTIRGSLDAWTYQQKSQLLTSLMATPEVAPLRLLHYDFEVLSAADELLSLKQILGSRVQLTSQPLTARYGFEVPEGVEANGSADLYENCFDQSLVLTSHLQAHSNELSTYGVLQGHKVRARLQLDGQALPALRELTATNSTANLLWETICATHPLITIAFSN